MLLLSGIRDESNVYFYRNYTYYRDTRLEVASNIFRCSKRTTYACSGRVYTDDDLNVEDSVEHVQHPKEENYVEEHAFRREIYELCETTNRSFEAIFTEVQKR